MLAVHAVDLFWLVMPAYNPNAVVVHPIDFFCLAGVGGFCLYSALAVAGNVRLLPLGDPRLNASLHFVSYP
jgi:hypothetical protein